MDYVTNVIIEDLKGYLKSPNFSEQEKEGLRIQLAQEIDKEKESRKYCKPIKKITVQRIYTKPKKRILWGHKLLVEESEISEEEFIEKGFEDCKI